MTIETRDFDHPDRPYKVVLERLVLIDDREYVRCPLHGLILLDHQCSQSPGDHWCREAAHPATDPARGADGLDDQMVTHAEWSSIQSAKIHYIASLHVKEVDEVGGTEGTCAECGLMWPCRTAHMAVGWGEANDCEDAGWCQHAGVPLRSC
jgi:hypothetical protein